MSVDAPQDPLACLAAELLWPASSPPARVRRVTREPSPFATLAAVEVLSVHTEDGGEVRLFVKHPGHEQSGHPDKQRRDRELLVYEHLLAGRSDLPVARYYGNRPNPATGLADLFLEHVPDWSLQYQDLEHWYAGARCLARLHAHFAERAELRGTDFLLSLDPAYFVTWAERAVAAVAGRCTELAGCLSDVLAGYQNACDLVARQPATLVHNDLAPKNVIADRSASPARICLVDWELAGVGCGLLDLVHLKYGLKADPDRRMIDAYRDELGGTNLLPRDEAEFERLLAACELHKTLYRLAHDPGWNLPLATIARWVADARQFMRQVERE